MDTAEVRLKLIKIQNFIVDLCISDKWIIGKAIKMQFSKLYKKVLCYVVVLINIDVVNFLVWEAMRDIWKSLNYVCRDVARK